jgi:signal transduction histidine kinase
MEELKDAQGKLLLTEKMAALGRLAAGISHELNSPLAAIAASNRVELKQLGSGLDELLIAAGRLGEGELALIGEARRMAASAASGGIGADTKAERLSRREAAELLSSSGVPGAQAIADELVELGLAGMVGRSVPALRGPRAADFLFVLRGVVGTIQAARISEDAIGKASRVVSALRGYVRGGPGEEPEAVELGPELAGLVDLYYDRVKRGVDVAIDIAPGAAAMGRKEELGRIWFNLLDNAFHAVGDKGSISIAARRAGGDVFVSVIDSGPGIPDEARPRIFEPFFTTKVAGEGTGLGLNIARRLARDNGGDIGFESRPGRTEFTVRLPAAPLGEAAGSPPP